MSERVSCLCNHHAVNERVNCDRGFLNDASTKMEASVVSLEYS